MKILLYNPDNGVTQNFMPHLWMFLLQSLTPEGHEVTLIDGNTQPMNDDELVRFAQREGDRAGGDRRDDAHDREGIPGCGCGSGGRNPGGHGRTARHGMSPGGARERRRSAARGRDRARRSGRDVAEDRRGRGARTTARSVHAGRRVRAGEEADPAGLSRRFRGTSSTCSSSTACPAMFRPLMRHYRAEWETFHIIPIESGRGCPYGCEFCTVTGFFGDSIRFRTNQSIVVGDAEAEGARAEARAERSRSSLSTTISRST